MRGLLVILFIISCVSCVCQVDTYKNYCCNDLEMLNQCKYSQGVVNEFVENILNSNLNNTVLRAELKKQFPDLECDKHVWCCLGNDHSYLYCQNMVSYSKCLNSKYFMEKFIFTAKKYGNVEFEDVPEIECTYHYLTEDFKFDTYNYYGAESSATVLSISYLAVLLILILN